MQDEIVFKYGSAAVLCLWLMIEVLTRINGSR